MKRPIVRQVRSSGRTTERAPKRKRSVELALTFLRPGEIVVDNFAGGGGASTGIAMAIGRDPDIAINHDFSAIVMHRANHPNTTHYCENIWKVNPKKVCAGRPVGLVWLSPDCTHHSKAKGGKPKKKKIRGLAWTAVKWAHDVRPRVMMLENVEEFEDWGPLGDDDKPIKALKGKTFKAWVRKLRSYGYDVEWRILIAADFGTPTTRKRLFVIARCDGQPIVWPEPTHGPGREQEWRSAAEIIDWSLPVRSIFGRKKPLVPATMARIAEGVRRFVLECPRPFIVGGGDRPMIPTLIQTGYGERKGQKPRVPGLGKPLGTVVPGGKHALVAALLSKHYTGMVGHGVERPIGTVTAIDHHSLTTATLIPIEASFITKFYGTSTGHDLRDPLSTVTAGGWHLGEVRAFLLKYYSARGRPGSQQQSLFDPLHTVTTKARFGLVTIAGEDYAIVDIGMRMLHPRELFAAQGFPASYVIAPVVRGKRGLKPLTMTQQIDKCGNAVNPRTAKVLVLANLARKKTAKAA